MDNIRVGLWQEAIIRRVILNTANEYIGQPWLHLFPEGPIREVAVWESKPIKYTLRWWKPNTHPLNRQRERKPEFTLTVDTRRVLNIESKNWSENYKPLSLATTKSHIVDRFQSERADRNVLVITALRLEKTARSEILRLLCQNGIACYLTGHKATSALDYISYKRIRYLLKPLLCKVFTGQMVEIAPGQRKWRPAPEIHTAPAASGEEYAILR